MIVGKPGHVERTVFYDVDIFLAGIESRTHKDSCRFSGRCAPEKPLSTRLFLYPSHAVAID